MVKHFFFLCSFVYVIFKEKFRWYSVPADIIRVLFENFVDTFSSAVIIISKIMKTLFNLHVVRFDLINVLEP